MTQPNHDAGGRLAGLAHGVFRIRWFHHVETLLIALAVPFVMTVLIFGMRLDSTVHEWANFLKHYDAASPADQAGMQGIALGTYIFSALTVAIARGTSTAVRQ